jgi:hypothetical protein
MDEPHSYERREGEPIAAAPIDASRKNKTRFTCPGCGQNAWGKPGPRDHLHAVPDRDGAVMTVWPHWVARGQAD